MTGSLIPLMVTQDGLKISKMVFHGGRDHGSTSQHVRLVPYSFLLSRVGFSPTDVFSHFIIPKYNVLRPCQLEIDVISI